MSKYSCRCGRLMDTIKSYFNKKGSRVTVCDVCAKKYGFDNESEYRCEEYKLTKEQNANNK